MLTENSPMIGSGSPTALSAPAAGTRDGTSSVVRNGKFFSMVVKGPSEALFTDNWYRGWQLPRQAGVNIPLKCLYDVTGRGGWTMTKVNHLSGLTLPYVGPCCIRKLLVVRGNAHRESTLGSTKLGVPLWFMISDIIGIECEKKQSSFAELLKLVFCWPSQKNMT